MENIAQKIMAWDNAAVVFGRHYAAPFSRFSVFLIYFWFGALKVWGLSPANPLVATLLSKTLPFISPESFFIALGVFEMVVGLMFIIPRLTRLGIFFIALHFITAMLPLFVLPAISWQGFLTPTLEGQYMIKNILILALVLNILSHRHPFGTEVKNV